MLNAYRRATLTALAVLALLALSIGSASAHAKFKSSTPAAGSSVASAPTTVTVTFDNHDPLQAEGSVLKVTDAAGAAADIGDTTLDKNDADRKTLAVSLKSGLGNGTYTVNWTAVSSGDGSTAEGSFTFNVGEALAGTPQQLPRTSDGGDTLPWLIVCGSVLLIGLGLALRYRTSRGASHS